MKTVTMFRKWKDGTILALFPLTPATLDAYTCDSYEHVGQHGAARHDVVGRTKPANRMEYAELESELRSIGYDLHIVKRIPHGARIERQRQLDLMHLNDFTRAYIGCALWSSRDDKDVPLDSNYDLSDIAGETLHRMVIDCAKFQRENAVWLTDENQLPQAGNYTILERAGHDFWLTRNGHGSGFWDSRWVYPSDDALTNAAHKYGEVHLHVVRGKIYA